MRAPTNLHILASSSGLSDEVVVALWDKARAAAIAELGDDSHEDYKRTAEGFMIRLIEDKATEGVPPNLVPWVMFDIHMGMAIVEARNSIKIASNNVRSFFSGSRDKNAA